MHDNKLKVMKLLENLGIPYEEFRETLRVKSKDSLIAFYDSGNVGLVDEYGEITEDINGILEYIKNNW